MRLPNAAHEGHPWVISQIVSDFQLLDVWALPTPGGPDDFDALLEVMASLDPANGESRVSRALFRLRFCLGRWFGWDDATRKLPVPGRIETSLSARLPEELRGTATGLAVGAARFAPLYRTDDEWAAEISNSTVHGVLHMAWVDQGEGIYRGQMGVYVKTRGPLGATYMALI
ncbi:MAG TPA: DUF2867 domain-containing protein, partial [Candidatus Dormibacteraeota bacterium]|nr:DUF2867 domain-containing protein [Candidatus Dormibacteraeota bacterium]